MGFNERDLKVALWVFQGQYVSSLSINYVAINKDLEKLPPQLYRINDIGVVTATK